MLVHLGSYQSKTEVSVNQNYYALVSVDGGSPVDGEKRACVRRLPEARARREPALLCEQLCSLRLHSLPLWKLDELAVTFPGIFLCVESIPSPQGGDGDSFLKNPSVQFIKLLSQLQIFLDSALWLWSWDSTQLVCALPWQPRRAVVPNPPPPPP